MTPTDAAQPESTRIAIVAARNEADRIGATIRSLRAASPGIKIVVADDGSADATAQIASGEGADVVSRDQPLGKGGNMTAAAEHVIKRSGDQAVVLLCDGDLGETAGRLIPLLEAVEADRCDLAIAAFARKVGGGVGAAKGFARWAIRSLSGYEATEPISGQRALSVASLRSLVPFAPKYGMETAMTIDAVRAGMRIEEIELQLEHRATGKTLAGFRHRGRQLTQILAAYVSRR